MAVCRKLNDQSETGKRLPVCLWHVGAFSVGYDECSLRRNLCRRRAVRYDGNADIFMTKTETKTINHQPRARRFIIFSFRTKLSTIMLTIIVYQHVYVEFYCMYLFIHRVQFFLNKRLLTYILTYLLTYLQNHLCLPHAIVASFYSN